MKSTTHLEANSTRSSVQKTTPNTYPSACNLERAGWRPWECSFSFCNELHCAFRCKSFSQTPNNLVSWCSLSSSNVHPPRSHISACETSDMIFLGNQLLLVIRSSINLDASRAIHMAFECFHAMSSFDGWIFLEMCRDYVCKLLGHISKTRFLPLPRIVIFYTCWSFGMVRTNGHGRSHHSKVPKQPTVNRGHVE